MDSRHESEEVRAYLLGALGERESSALEAQYFLDPRLLQQLQDSEKALIRDYLAKRLSQPDRTRFESRYLTNPTLMRVVEEVRAEMPPERRWSRWVWVGGLAAASAAVVGVTLMQRPAAVRPSVTKQAVISVPPTNTAGVNESKAVVPVAPKAHRDLVALFLAPGLTKGASAETPRLVIPPNDVRVRLILDVPGETARVSGVARISGIGDDGRQTVVMTTPVLESTPVEGGQHAVIEFSGAHFPSGDYIVALSDKDGNVLDSYVFRAVRKEK